MIPDIAPKVEGNSLPPEDRGFLLRDSHLPGIKISFRANYITFMHIKQINQNQFVR